MKKTSTLKPLDIGRKLLTDEEFSELLADYKPMGSGSNENSSFERSSSSYHGLGSEPLPDSDNIQRSYILMSRANNYAQGVHALQETCQQEGNQNHPQYVRPNGSRIYRPLTFKENIQTKVEDYETLTDEQGNERSLDDRMRFFNTWLDSCCGIAYKGRTTKFKLVPLCKELITIDRDSEVEDLFIDYDSMQGIELDFLKANYGDLLTKDGVLNHPAWLAAVEGDKALLGTYADMIFNETEKEKAMGFWVLNHPCVIDEIRTLFVNYDDTSSAFGVVGIHGRNLLRVAS